MSDYAESKTEDGERTYVRFQSADGRPITVSSISINGETSKTLKHAVSIGYVCIRSKEYESFYIWNNALITALIQ